MRSEPLVLTVAEGGRRLDQYLAGPLGSRARAQSLIKSGLVTVNGRPRPSRHIVRAGERIEVQADRPPVPGAEPGAPIAYQVAYEDEHLLVVDKPPGVVVHPARGHPTGTLAQALAGHAAGGEDPWRAGIVHRLDRDTSGLLVVAKDDAVHRALKALLAARQLKRQYLALVEGHPSARTGMIDAPIGRDRRDRTRVSLDTDVPRAARTHFVVERRLASTALLRVDLDTGRTHQIRVHLAAIGHRVCGDRLYGTPGRFGLERQFLHAARLSFPHPLGGQTIDVSSPLPADLQQALRLAEQEVH
jgi:23S rRNA pseudouridine1911/1915/1917 synthase